MRLMGEAAGVPVSFSFFNYFVPLLYYRAFCLHKYVCRSLSGHGDGDKYSCR